MAEEIIVIDTSVAIKWLIKEDDSEKAQKALHNLQKKKVRIVFPDIVLLEVINALSLGIQKLPEAEIQEAVNFLFNLQPIEFISLCKKNITSIINIVGFSNIASYDAMFIALAKERNCVLLTADRKHHKKEIYSKIKYL